MQFCWGTLFTTPLNHQRFDDYHWFFAADFAGELYLLPSWITKDLMIFIDFLLLICMKTFENLMVFMQISWWTLFTTPLNHQRFDDYQWFFAADLHENLWKLDGFHAILLGNFIYYPPGSPKIWWFSLIFCCWFAWKPLKTWWFSCKSAGELYLLPSWITKDLMIFIDFLLLICMKTYENLMAFMQISWGTLFTTLLNHQRFDDFHWFLLLVCMFSTVLAAAAATSATTAAATKKGKNGYEWWWWWWWWWCMMMHDGGWWWWWWWWW